MKQFYQTCCTIILLSILSITGVFAQQTVTGKVTNANGNLPGVNVAIKGTSRGTQSGSDGNYSIQAAPGEKLRFSMVGYISQEISVGSTKTINVTLQPDESTLDEVVVTAMGIKRDQRKLGYAVSTVKAEDIQEGSPSIGASLYGKAPGVRIQTSPGGQIAASGITIRGQNSISFARQPLIILDGIPIRNGEANTQGMWDESRIMGNGLLDVNPNDIESISILKGAPASALYGSEAVGGVLVITTKKGSQKTGLGIDFNMNMQSERLAFLPEFQHEFGPGYGWTGPNGLLTAGADADGFFKTTGRDGKSYIRPSMGSWGNYGPKFDNRDVMWWDGEIRQYSAQPNGMKDLYDKGNTNNYSLSVSNSGDLGSFRFSYNRNDFKGISPGTKQNRNNFNFNGTLNVSKKITFDLTTSYINTYTLNRPYLINNVNAYGYNLAEKADVVRSKYRTSKGYQFTNNKTWDPEEYILYGTSATQYMQNILWNNLVNKDMLRENRFITSATLNYKPIDPLSFRIRLGNDITSNNNETENPNTQNVSFANSGYYGTRNGNQRVTYGDFLGSYNKSFNDFEVGISLGAMLKQEKNQYTSIATAGGLVQENFFSLNNSLNRVDTGFGRGKVTRTGIFGIATLGYKNQLFGELSVRRESSSTLPPANNSFTYPSMSLSWIISESLANRPDWLNYTKLRTAYGFVGNDLSAYAANNAYKQETINGVIVNFWPTVYGNDYIRPERKREFEVGLESKLFDNRIGLDITYYNNAIKDQITYIDVPGSSGVTSMLSNLAKMTNYGLEIGLNANPVRTETWNYNVGVNFSFNRNRVSELPTGGQYLKLADIDNNAVMVVASPNAAYGDIMTYSYKRDQNGNKLVDDEGYYIKENTPSVRGNVTPKGIGGITNNVSFDTGHGKIAFTALIDYRIGGDIFSLSNYQNTASGKLASTLQGRDAARGGISYYVAADGTNKAVQPGTPVPGDAKFGGRIFDDGIIADGYKEDGTKNNTIMLASYYYLFNNYWNSGIYDNQIYDNSYVKLREVTLSYTLPARLAARLKARNVTLSLIGRNLFYIYKNVPNIDPESAIGTTPREMGLDRYGIPTSRSYGFSLKFGI